jgi:AcrR family transcriptional regulator
MEREVNRNYSSALRDAQARQTRRAIVEVGSRLFVARGFGRTTVDEIAAAAGVSRKTVFTSVGGKAEILKLALDWAIVGDDEPIPLAARPEAEQLMAQTDPRAILFGWIDMGVQISARVSGVFGALVVAAGIDDDARRLHEQALENRRAGARAAIRAVAKAGGLRDGLGEKEAADVAWVYGDPQLYDTLVVQRGWSRRRFADWLKQTAAFTLLGDVTGL